MPSFGVTLDQVAYTSKPDAEVGAITRRLQAAGATEMDAASFAEHVRQGKTWVGGCYEPRRGAWGAFKGQQIVALDFDNDTADGFLDPCEAIDRCAAKGLEPMMLYFTMSARYPDRWRYRLVFDMGEPLPSEDAAKAVISTLLALFPEADTKCKNPNRIFFGSNGEVWELWKLWEVGDDGEE